MRIKVLGLIGLLVSALLLATSWAYGLTINDSQVEKATYQCFTPSIGTMLYAMEEHINGHRINTQAFDQTGDGEPDVLLGYEYVGTNGLLRAFPTLYVFGLATKYEAEFIDTMGNGRCTDIKQIPVGSGFTGKRL